MESSGYFPYSIRFLCLQVVAQDPELEAMMTKLQEHQARGACDGDLSSGRKAWLTMDDLRRLLQRQARAHPCCAHGGQAGPLHTLRRRRAAGNLTLLSPASTGPQLPTQ